MKQGNVQVLDFLREAANFGILEVLDCLRTCEAADCVQSSDGCLIEIPFLANLPRVLLPVCVQLFQVCTDDAGHALRSLYIVAVHKFVHASHI